MMRLFLALLFAVTMPGIASPVSFAWDAVAGATGYTLGYGPQPGDRSTLVQAGAQTSLTFNLATGTYYFAVRDFNASTTSGFSNEIQVVVLGQPPPLNQPPTISLAAAPASCVVPCSSTLTATAADPDGTVASVAFYKAGVLVQTLNAPPWQYVASVASVGAISYNAIATDNQAAATTSNSVTVTGTGAVTQITIGQTTILPTADNGNGGLLLAQSATLSQAATIQSLSFYVTTAGGSLRLGIYDATGPSGGPGALKAQTASFVPVVGWNTQVVATPVGLAAGNYWLAYFPSSGTLAFRKGAGTVVSRYTTLSFGPMPSPFPASPAYTTSSVWSLYATLSIP